MTLFKMEAREMMIYGDTKIVSLGKADYNTFNLSRLRITRNHRTGHLVLASSIAKPLCTVPFISASSIAGFIFAGQLLWIDPVKTGA